MEATPALIPSSQFGEAEGQQVKSCFGSLCAARNAFLRHMHRRVFD
jgi:hypothetical protein